MFRVTRPIAVWVFSLGLIGTALGAAWAGTGEDKESEAVRAEALAQLERVYSRLTGPSGASPEELSKWLESEKKRTEQLRRALVRSALKKMELQGRKDLPPAVKQAAVRAAERSSLQLQAEYTVARDNAKAIEEDRELREQHEQRRAIERRVSEPPSSRSTPCPELGGAMRAFGLKESARR